MLQEGGKRYAKQPAARSQCEQHGGRPEVGRIESIGERQCGRAEGDDNCSQRDNAQFYLTARPQPGQHAADTHAGRQDGEQWPDVLLFEVE